MPTDDSHGSDYCPDDSLAEPSDDFGRGGVEPIVRGGLGVLGQQTNATQARELARRHKADAHRLRRILERMSSYDALESATEAELFDEMPRYGALLRPHLKLAIEILPAEDALTMFEAEDLTQLTKRVLGTEYLCAMSDQLRTLDELERLIESFLSYLERNRTHLLRTGYPETSFEPSEWLQTWLGNLYYTKLPTSIDKTRPVRSTGGYDTADTAVEELPSEYTYRYHWGKRAAIGEEVGKKGLRKCTYEEAALLGGLSVPDADAVAEIRSKLFDLKIDVLALLLKRLRRRDVSKLPNELVESIYQALSGRGVELCFGMDRFYRARARADSSGLLPGGLSTLLEVAWHLKQEVDIGTWRKTRKEIADLIDIDSLGRPQLSVNHYFSAIHTGQDQALDGALCLLDQLQAEANRARAVYYEQVDQLLYRSYGGLTTRPEERPERARAMAQTMAEFLQQETGREAAAVATAPQLEENVFRKEVDSWRVVYQGKEAQVKDTLGMHHICQLLSNPGQELSAIWLDSQLPMPKDGKAESAIPTISVQEAPQDAYEQPWSADPGKAIDDQAVKELAREKERLEEEADMARQRGDPEAAVLAQDEADAIARYLSASLDVRGRPRKMASPPDDARKRVWGRLETAYRNIAKAGHKALALHLRNTIRRRSNCRYIPEEPIDWMTS